MIRLLSLVLLWWTYVASAYAATSTAERQLAQSMRLDPKAYQRMLDAAEAGKPLHESLLKHIDDSIADLDDKCAAIRSCSKSRVSGYHLQSLQRDMDALRPSFQNSKNALAKSQSDMFQLTRVLKETTERSQRKPLLAQKLRLLNTIRRLKPEFQNHKFRSVEKRFLFLSRSHQAETALCSNKQHLCKSQRDTLLVYRKQVFVLRLKRGIRTDRYVSKTRQRAMSKRVKCDAKHTLSFVTNNRDRAAYSMNPRFKGGSVILVDGCKPGTGPFCMDKDYVVPLDNSLVNASITGPGVPDNTKILSYVV